MNRRQTKPFLLSKKLSKLRERKKEPDMLPMNSTHFTSIRDQVANLFKELAKNINKFSTLVFALIVATNIETGKSLFMKHDKLMMCLVLTIVLYSLVSIIGTILQIYNRTLLPIIVCAMLIVASAASVLALSFISSTIAWVTLVLWLGIFTLVAYEFVVYQRSSELLLPL